MNRLWQAHRWTVLCAAGWMLVFQSAAQASNPPMPINLVSAPAGQMPPMPQFRSPVDSFRQLLAMTPEERDRFMMKYPPDARTRILAKVQEYLVLDPNERELRLRATELRWYLLPLLREPQTNRVAQLATVPEDLRDLVSARLEQWYALPPQYRQEFLDNEQTLDYFSHVDPTNGPVNFDGAHGPPVPGQTQGRALSEAERKKITEQFARFFELTPAEEQKTLNTLSDAERAQMEKTLQSFDKLPPTQRIECVRAFTKFAGMTPQDRAEFLKNAERWSQLSPKERQAWRDLVDQVPQWPPMPAVFLVPPMPKLPTAPISQRASLLMATNHN